MNKVNPFSVVSVHGLKPNYTMSNNDTTNKRKSNSIKNTKHFLSQPKNSGSVLDLRSLQTLYPWSSAFRYLSKAVHPTPYPTSILTKSNS